MCRAVPFPTSSPWEAGTAHVRGCRRPPGEQKLQPGNAALRWRLDHKRSISNPHPPPPDPRAEACSTPGPENIGDFTKLSFLGSSWLVRGNPCRRGVVGTCPRMKFSFQPLSFSSESLLAGGLSEATQKARKTNKKKLVFPPSPVEKHKHFLELFWVSPP